MGEGARPPLAERRDDPRAFDEANAPRGSGVMIDLGRIRLWLLAAVGLVVLSASTALLAQGEAGSGAASASPSIDPAELNARIDALLSRAEARLQESTPESVTLSAEVAALHRELASAKAQIEILKSAIVEAVLAQSSAETELGRLKGEPSSAAPGAPGAADPSMRSVLNYAEGLSDEPPAAGTAPSAEAGGVTRSLGTVGEARVASDRPPAPERATSRGEDAATDAPAGERSPDGVMITEIHFNPGRADLTPGGRRKTLDAAERIRAMPEGNVRVVGHTDTVGGADYNKHLALRRADSIAELLADVGVPHERIEIVGAGEDALPEPTADQIPEPLNRCAGIIVVADGSE
jgi:outer membrane protein OmpA-like peptidoglycan-associated protein